MCLISCEYLPGGGVDVKITNASKGNVADLNVHFTGGLNVVPKLNSGEMCSLKVNPSAASHLTIAFVDSLGITRTNKIDVYFERNYRGVVDITINDGGSVSFTNRIKPY